VPLILAGQMMCEQSFDFSNLDVLNLLGMLKILVIEDFGSYQGSSNQHKLPKI